MNKPELQGDLEDDERRRRGGVAMVLMEFMY